jgi:NAD(P)-dependent dehydrogenase (short-subunit alcohol dehydrogenase family)
LVWRWRKNCSQPGREESAARSSEGITLDSVDRVRLDVTKPDTISAAASQGTDVNLLIHNAGISVWTGFFSPDAVEAVRAEMETNHFGPLLVSRAFARFWRRTAVGLTSTFCLS